MLSKSGQTKTLDVSETGLEVASKNIIEVANRYKLTDHNVYRSTNDRKDLLAFQHHWERLLEFTFNDQSIREYFGNLKQKI